MPGDGRVPAPHGVRRARAACDDSARPSWGRRLRWHQRLPRRRATRRRDAEKNTQCRHRVREREGGRVRAIFPLHANIIITLRRANANARHTAAPNHPPFFLFPTWSVGGASRWLPPKREVPLLSPLVPSLALSPARAARASGRRPSGETPPPAARRPRGVAAPAATWQLARATPPLCRANRPSIGRRKHDRYDSTVSETSLTTSR